MKRTRLLIPAILCALQAFAQQQFPTLERGFRPEKLYHFGEIDSVNVFSGTLIVNLPIGPQYALNGGVSYGLNLSYNSKPWDFLKEGDFVHAIPSRRSSAGMGWVIGMGRYVPDGQPDNLSGIDLYEAPDGGDHRFDGVSADGCTSACPSYTSDGTNLRLRKPAGNIAEIDFPDGITKKFTKNAANGWDLREIRNSKSSDIVTITPGTGAPTGCSPTTDSYWAISDSQGRTHTVCFSDLSVNSVLRPMVDRVLFASPGGTAVYNFIYDPITLNKPSEDTDSNEGWRQTHDVQLLKTITLPDGSQYRFALGGGGVLGSITLPTLGKITYQYNSWLVPSTNMCENTYGSGFGFGGHADGVERRTFTPAVPAGQTPVSRTWIYDRQLRAGGSPSSYTSVRTCITDMGPGNPPEPMPVELYDELVVTVTDPLGHKTASHFSVWPGQDEGRTPDPDTSPAGFKRLHYGYPYGRYDAAQDRYLSREIFDCTNSCELRQSIWVRHVPVPRWFDPNGTFPTAPNRQESQSTVFHDDPAGCTGDGLTANCARTSTDYADWDGYGHYRGSSTTTQFHSDLLIRTVTTAWNKIAGVQRTIEKDDPWLLNTYESISTTASGTTAFEQACFDPATGFLRGRRTLVGSSPAATDLLVVYENENLDGNTSAENFYGGDLNPISENQPVLCSAIDALDDPLSTTTLAYRIHHAWQYGHLAQSQYDGVSFFSHDFTINRDGLVTASRDSGGLETTYGYDTNWRLTSVTPPGQATTTYTYTNAVGSGTTLTSPAKVVESTQSQNAGTVQREYQFDAFGRLWRQKQLMPNGQWNLRETLYDQLSRTASVSEPASLQGVSNELGFSPPNRTSHEYDYLGRVLQTTLPDGTSTNNSYQGSRTTTRTSMVATGASETMVGKREEYDAIGRLVAVVENVDLHPEDGIDGELLTNYTYDVGNRLISVAIQGLSGTQQRTFNYDKRGFLISEKHPEIGVNGHGTTFYSKYDARGHAGRKLIGTLIDVGSEYDEAERLIRIVDATQGDRPLALFSWDCVRPDVNAPCGTVTHPGRLAASARYNYDSELGTIAVTQSNGYHSTTGQLIRRDNAVGDGALAAVPKFAGQAFFFTQSHNDLGLLDTLTYPCRTGTSGCVSGDPGRSISHGYAIGQLQSVGTYASAMTYHPTGAIDTITHGSGASAVLEKWEAEPHGMARPRRIYATNASGTQLWSTGNYEFDGSGNIKQIGNTAYHYDGFGRLVSWMTMIGNTASTRVRMLDGYGNELTSSSQFCGPSGLLFSCSSGAVAPPRSIQGTTNRFADTTYDAAGNVTADTSQRTYTWDPLGMMTSATVQGRTFRYLYTADNERIAAIERVPVGTELRNRTTFSLRGAANQLLSTWTDDWTSGSRVFTRKEDSIWRGSHLLARVAGSSTTHYTLDHLGSPRLITNASGAVLDQQNFDPFGGGGLHGSGALQFTAHERDQSNLGHGSFPLPDYLHARYYDMNGGRFLSVDPGMDPKRNMRAPQRWNQYAYALNNPLLRVDPDGMKDTIFVINTSNAGVFNTTAQARLNASVEGTRFEGRVQVIGPFATAGQVRSFMSQADRSDMVAVLAHSGSTQEWAPGKGGMMLAEKSLQVPMTGATLATWAGSGGSPGVCMLAGCNSAQLATTVSSGANTTTLGTTANVVGGEIGMATAVALGALAQGQSPQAAAAAASQELKTPANHCAGNPTCDPNEVARVVAVPPQ